MNNGQFKLFLLGAMLILCVSRDAGATEDFSLVLGLNIPANCDQKYCRTETAVGLSPGSLIRVGAKPTRIIKQCAAQLQNQAGFVRYDSKVLLLQDAPRQMLLNGMPSSLQALRRVVQTFKGEIKIEVALQYREDIEESQFQALVRSVPADCRAAANADPARWDVVTSRYFGRATILISVPPEARTEDVFEALKPFVERSGADYEISVHLPRQLGFIGKDFVLYAVKTQSIVDYVRLYPNGLE